MKDKLQQIREKAIAEIEGSDGLEKNYIKKEKALTNSYVMII